MSRERNLPEVLHIGGGFAIITVNERLQNIENADCWFRGYGRFLKKAPQKLSIGRHEVSSVAGLRQLIWERREKEGIFGGVRLKSFGRRT